MNRKPNIKNKNRNFTLAAEILMYFFAFVDFMPLPFEGKLHYTKRILKGSTNYYSYYRVLKKLEEKGWLKVYKDPETNRNLFKLTEAGKLESLFIKARLPNKQKWDGKWRMIIFDIPEDARTERDRLRRLLKLNGFKILQKSVIINP